MASANNGDPAIKELEALRIDQRISIDGQLDEAIWSTAELASDFVQTKPNTGQPASQRTEVRLLYDNNNLYVGAHIYDDPDLILNEINKRDNESNASSYKSVERIYGLTVKMKDKSLSSSW